MQWVRKLVFISASHRVLFFSLYYIIDYYRQHSHAIIWKIIICHSGPRCGFVWLLCAVYLPVKHSCLCNKWCECGACCEGAINEQIFPMSLNREMLAENRRPRAEQEQALRCSVSQTTYCIISTEQTVYEHCGRQHCLYSTILNTNKFWSRNNFSTFHSQEAADRQRAVAAAVPTISSAPEVLYDKYYQLVIID